MVEGQWLRHAEGLPDGFWLGLQQILSIQTLFVGFTRTRLGSSLWHSDNGWASGSILDDLTE
jgi:hypothetical protein